MKIRIEAISDNYAKGKVPYRVEWIVIGKSRHSNSKTGKSPESPTFPNLVESIPAANGSLNALADV